MLAFINPSLPACLYLATLIALLIPPIPAASELRFPIKHRFSTHLQRISTPTPPPPLAGIRSKLITLNESLGEYFAVMQLGSPPQEIAVIIDTGSELIWVQCQPCIHCEGQVLDPIFKPASSKTFRNITCHSPWCSEEHGGGMALSCSELEDSTCLFNTSYVDGSNSSGYIAEDTLTVITTENKTTSVPDFVFGCADYDTGTSLNASGTMGLDRGNHSVVSQLGVQVLSYCLPDRTENIDSEGYITLGKGSSDSNNRLQYTKLIHNTAATGVDQFYYVNLTGISVGKQLLNIPASALQLNLTSGSGGTIIDSGTTLTYLMDGAYRVFRDAIINQITGDVLPVTIPGISLLELCYLIVDGVLGIPSVILHFEGGVDLDLPVHNIMVQVTRNTYCLAFGNAGEVGEGIMNIIGNFQQQNILVEFNVGTSQIGFEHSNCSEASIDENISPASGISPTPNESISPASGISPGAPNESISPESGGGMTPAQSPSPSPAASHGTNAPSSISPPHGSSSSPVGEGSPSTSVRCEATYKQIAIIVLVAIHLSIFF